MLIDLAQGGPARIAADVAIVGTGVAGLTAARRLLAGGLSVLLIESGGLDYARATAELNAGSVIGMEYYPLKDARLRFFGGTTAIWGGRCAELDPIDLERRPWVPHSGWPIGWEELAAWYGEARALFGIHPQALDPSALRDGGIPVPLFDPAEVEVRSWSFDERFDRFRFEHCTDLTDHPRLTVLIHATVREIAMGAIGDAAVGLDVIGPGGRQVAVTAGDYLLAAGGIETPRLLMASRSSHAAGVGNGHDQVGRYFMEHPHARGGRIVTREAWRWLAAFGKRRVGGRDTAALLVPGRALQERDGLLNTSLTIAGRRPADGRESWAMRAYLHAKHHAAPDRRGRALWRRTKQAANWAQRHGDPLRPWLLHRMGRLDLALVVRAEQAPNPASRIILTRDTDATGMPRVALDWRTNRQDRDSVAGLVSALDRESARLGLGRVEPAAWLGDGGEAWVTDPLISAHPIGGYHHMGTTRMSADPRHGVTDGLGRVHGIANLHIAGSALFPTGGWANPTLTIAALALRTADAILKGAAKGQRPQD